MQFYSARREKCGNIQAILLYLKWLPLLLRDPRSTFQIMATPPNKMYNATPSRLEQAAAVDQELKRIEDAIRKLKIDFDIFFAGSVKRPPLEARARLESNIKRISDNRTLSFAQRYQLNTLISRFTSYRELWRRTLKARGDDLI